MLIGLKQRQNGRKSNESGFFYAIDLYRLRLYSVRCSCLCQRSAFELVISAISSLDYLFVLCVLCDFDLCVEGKMVCIKQLITLGGL